MRKTITLSLLMVVILLTALTGSLVFGAGEEGLEKAEEARQGHTNELMAIDGVVGVALGINPAGKGAVLVLTTNKDVAGIPKQLDKGVPVRVMVTGNIFSLDHCTGHSGRGKKPCRSAEDPTPTPEPAPGDGCPDTLARYRPACIGISTGHPAITACTIGVRLTDGTDVYALSNNHCYAASNAAIVGDAVIQPGTFDGGSSSADNIGYLEEFEPIKFGNLATCDGTLSDPDCNIIDAAIALSTTANLGNATPSDGYGTPKSTTVSATLQQKVIKYGRTTRQTNGTVVGVNATIDVGYSGGVARFVDQIVVISSDGPFVGSDPFILGGDSGSLLVTQRGGHKSVGLLYAGTFPDGLYGIANPIDAVLNRYGVTIDGN